MCDDCGWEEVLSQIDELLNDDDALFAEDTLSGIRDFIIDKEHVTTGQCSAVDNIQSAVDRRK